VEKTSVILIVEDEPIIAEDIKGHLLDAGFINIKVVHDFHEAMIYLNSHEIDFVLIDVVLDGGKDGIELAKKINAEYHIPFVYITSNADSKTIEEIGQTYPVGYVLKPFQGREILAAIQIGYSLYYKFISPEKELNFEKLGRSFSTDLTEKEKEVLAKMLAGKSNKTIADELFVSINTIKTHLKNIFIKAEVKSRSELIVICNRN
jgi:DNA-binding NarL/FixJ family response regulator